jgi:transcriptional regulator with XRE-family HTH domain
MNSEAFVKLALENLLCSQKELALRLGVSPTQISKWKQGEHMSFDMENKFRALLSIGDKDPEFVVWAGSLEAANKWETLIRFLAEAAAEGAETGYDTAPLTDEPELLSWQTFHTLLNMGVALPKTFPIELDIDYKEDRDNEEDSDHPWDLIHKNPYSSLIYEIYKSFTDVYGFYVAYISDLVFDDELGLFEEVGENIDACLMDLAASKIEMAEVQDLAVKFQDFKYRVRQDYEKWLNVIKEKAFRAGVPLRAELLTMVYESNDALGDEAEKEHLGLNSSRLHPDIYMDELLRGMRIIHQVLPAIMKKLGMDDFTLDESQLRIN